MPKKFSDLDKKKWLDRYESGETEKGIANRIKADYRTVKNGIDEARKQRDARLAGIDLIKDALRRHQDRLLEALEQVISTTTLPPEDLTILSWHHGSDSIFSKPKTIAGNDRFSDSSGRREAYAEGRTHYDLLKQHLKRDRLWKFHFEWQKAWNSHRTARIDFQCKMVEVVEAAVGLKFDDQENTKGPYLCSYTLGPLFYVATLRRAFHPDTGADLDKEITADTTQGVVAYPGSILAVKVMRNAAKTREDLVISLDALRKLPELERVMTTYHHLEAVGPKVRYAAEEIKLLGIVPGECDICERLGV